MGFQCYSLLRILQVHFFYHSMRLSRLQFSILLAVAKYRFLTNSQLVLADLGKADTIRKTTRHLATHPPKASLLSVQKFPVNRRLGRLENVYSLATAGLEFVSESNPSLLRTGKINKATFDGDFFHRRACITFQLLLDKALSENTSHALSVETFDQYFHMTGSNRGGSQQNPLHSKTKIEFEGKRFFIPDCIFVIRNRKGQRALYAVECVFGDKTGRTLQQIKNHMTALMEGVISEKYRVQGQDYTALFFFHNEKLMERVRTKLAKPEWRFKSFRAHFLFATIADVERDVLSCWRKIGEDKNLYNCIDGVQTKSPRR